MATDDQFDSLVDADLGDSLLAVLVDEVHDVLKDTLRLVLEWLKMGAPNLHPSSSALHPARFVAEIPDEILVLAYGELASIYGDATRRATTESGKTLEATIKHRELVGRTVKLLETELVQRLEKR